MREYIFALEFISRVLTEAPNQELLRHMIQEPMAEHWPVSVDDEKENQGLELIQNFTRGEVTDLHKQLVQDYFTLFEMSPPRCYVHESVWLSMINCSMMSRPLPFALAMLNTGYRRTTQIEGPTTIWAWS